MYNLIGIAGGIGSGKSVVSRLLRLKGFTVYDCDSRAKLLMATDSTIKCRIRDEVSADVTDGIMPPDRSLLASIVFNDENARKRLNSIVHGAVITDLLGCLSVQTLGELYFVESAIIAESGIADLCKEIWIISSSDRYERLQRIINRDGIGIEKAEARLRAQQAEERLLGRYADKCVEILNDSDQSIIHQIDVLLDKHKNIN